MSNAVYLGKTDVYWCEKCNVPLLEKRCGLCNNEGSKIKLTPPGDIRPAFKGDLAILKNVIDNNIGDSSVLDNKLVLLNKVPGIDRTDEVIVDGHNIGNLAYTSKTYKFSLKLDSIPYFKASIKHWAVVDDGAVEPIKNSSNLLIPGVLSVSDNIQIGDEVMLFTKEQEPIGVGIAKAVSKTMLSQTRGVAVKVRASGSVSFKINLRQSGWEDAVNANSQHLRNLEAKAVKSIKKLDYNEKIVSFSGGKDSLVTLLLTLRSGIVPAVMFLNTGIELPETVEYTKHICKLLDLKLTIVDAGSAFWNALAHFGPPGKDYRWCCKTCKLGPTTRYLKTTFKTEVLTFIGQRAYESQQRAKKGSMWNNEWVPNQIGFSPVQHWNGLAIWLYIFESKIDYNPWYDLGLSRIGCFMCPSSDLADLKIVKEHYPDYEKWEKYLDEYSGSKNLPKEWLDLGIWRWKYPPGWLKEQTKNIVYDRHGREALNIRRVKSDNKTILKFNKSLDYTRIKNMLNAVPNSTYSLSHETEILNEEYTEKIEQLIIQAMECVGCGICTGRCRNNALYLKDGKAWIDESLCKHCSDCIGACPAYRF